MQIQYVGFNVAASSRIYNFHVVDAPDQIREFVLEVQSEAFRSSSLKFQDGPALCLARLKRELDGETQVLPAQACLCIGEQDIEEYIERHYPRKRR
ncbi:MAG: hypothetical protein HY644_12600 [Acidobacteria bacterium]|nr:hypothetical protein [Acidobacteriota bacterium]